MSLSDEYAAALVPLARVFEAYNRERGHFPVLVGGAAAAIYTAGLFPSGDFDVVAPSDQAFDAAMLLEGFVPEDRVGKQKIGFYHPDHLSFGYQQVTGPLFNGLSDRTRQIRIAVTADGDVVVLPAIEDIIADRLGQHCSGGSPTDDSMLLQARALFKLAVSLDVAYLKRRIGDEQGDPALLGL